MNPVETAPINAINPSSSGEGIDVFVFTKDLNGNYTFANPKVEELFASPLQDILGRNDSSFFDLTKADQLQLNDRRVMDHGETIVGLEQVYFRNSDQARVYATHKYPLRGPFGSIVGMLGVSIDVSERTKAEEDLQLYKRVLDQIQDYVTIIDLEGEVMYINRAGSNVNQKLSKFVGQNAAAHGLSSRDGFDISTIIRQTQTAGSWRGLLEGTQRDGHHVILDLRTALVRNAANLPIAIVGTATDISFEKMAVKTLSDSQAQHSVIMDSMADLIAVVGPADEIISSNLAWRVNLEKFNPSPEQLLPSWSYFDALEHIVASVDVGQLKMLSAGIRSVMASALPIFKVDYFCHDGEMERWFTLHATPLGGSPGVKGVVVTHRDITERRNALEKLQLAASIFFHAQEGILITSSDGIIVDINESFEIMSGYTRAELIGNNPRILSSGRQDRLFYSAMWHELTTKGHWTGEIWNRRKDGEVYAVQQTISAVRSDDGNIRQFISLGSDITSSKNHQREIERVFHYDVLTKLPNRVLFSDRIRQKLAHAKRSNETVAVLCMDLDDFKGINDEFGLHAGDQILIQVADRLRMNIRLEDTVARLGGDEFVVLLGDIPSRSACDQIIRHLLEELALPYALPDGRTTDTSASIGYTLFPEDDADPDTLIRHADHAMFLAKQAGKNRSSRFDISVDNRNKANWSALAKVERGIDRGEFKLFLQPKVSLSNGAVVGAEALIRWMHPIRGLTTPGHFLPLLEGQPTMLKLGSWVLREAFQMLRNWNELGIEIPMSVNVDAMQLRDSEFSKELSQLLLEFPSVPASRLELEIVESAALDDVQKVSILIDECHTLGAKFSLDDFGTGYSSLTYLKRLAVDTLKIDQSFVRDMLGDESALAIVRGVIGLADAFTAHTVAEGVETWEHAAKLRSLNCQIIQGYVIARPMPAERFPAWMEQFTMPDF